MTVRTVEEAEDAPLWEPLSRGRRRVGFGGLDCICCNFHKGGARIRHGKGHGKHRTLRAHRKGR